MKLSIRSYLKSFLKNQRGAVAVTFGLFVFVLMLCVGVAVDFARMHHVKTQLAAAADAAALAGGRAIIDGRLSDDRVREIVAANFRHNLKNGQTDIGDAQDPLITINRQSGEVRVEARANVPMTVSAITGTEGRPVGARAEVVATSPDLEVALAIDLTGSMGWGSKLSDLKDAAEEFLDIVMPDNGSPNTRRVALAPFSSGVNAGPLAVELLDSNSPFDCTFERDGTGTERVSDKVPPRGSLIKSLLAYLRTLGINGLDQAGSIVDGLCPDVVVQPLTDNKAQLLTQIRSYTADGSTAGHLGAQWASYLLSPKWSQVLGPGARPAEYNPSETVKVAIIMTDGLNNTYGGKAGNAASQQASQSDQLMIEFCQAMRAEDRKIQVYTIGFQLDDQRARDVLRQCAGNDENAIFAEDGDQLIEAYQEIARRISQLRVSG